MGRQPEAARRRSTRGVRCPTCRGASRPANPHRPFCSLTCRLVDLGVWLDEGYRIPAERVADDDRAPDEQEPDVP